MAFVIVLHVIVCIALIALVLIQRGRGSGLVESFAGVESMFGTKTSLFLTRLTTVLSVIFFISCLTLAFLAVRQSRSLMSSVRTPAVEQKASAPAIPEEKQPSAQAAGQEPPQGPLPEVPKAE